MRLVECGNPAVKELLSHTKRSAPKDFFQPIIRDSTKYCAWCNKNPIPEKKRKYCSDECNYSCEVFCYPQTSTGLFHLLERQNLKCNSCNYDWTEDLKKKQEIAINWINNTIKRMQEYKRYSQDQIKEKQERLEVVKSSILTQETASSLHSDIGNGYRPEIDHIIPVMAGGSTLGLENLQAICVRCHRSKTVQDRVDIRKHQEEIMGGARTKKEKEEWYVSKVLEAVGDQELICYEIKFKIKESSAVFSNKPYSFFEKIIQLAVKSGKLQEIKGDFLNSYRKVDETI